MGQPKLLKELYKRNVNLKSPLDLLARGIKLAVMGEKKKKKKPLTPGVQESEWIVKTD